jgi:hypothetical protein
VRSALALLVVIGATLPSSMHAEEPAPSGPAVLAVQETTVQGTPPALSGRWLSLGWVELPDGRVVNAVALWEIAEKDGKPVLTHRFVSLPPPLKKAVEAANAAGKAWKPSPEELSQLRAAWDGLTPETLHAVKVANIITGRDGLDDSLKGDERTKDALWVVQQRQDFDGSAGAAMRQVSVYAARAQAEGGYTGNFDTATIAAAPFPVPIAFKGTFQLYRVDEPARRGLVARFFDVFSGCQARRDVR